MQLFYVLEGSQFVSVLISRELESLIADAMESIITYAMYEMSPESWDVPNG